MLLQILHTVHELKRRRRRKKSYPQAPEDLVPPSGTYMKFGELIFELQNLPHLSSTIDILQLASLWILAPFTVILGENLLSQKLARQVSFRENSSKTPGILDWGQSWERRMWEDALPHCPLLGVPAQSWRSSLLTWNFPRWLSRFHHLIHSDKHACHFLCGTHVYSPFVMCIHILSELFGVCVCLCSLNEHLHCPPPTHSW